MRAFIQTIGSLPANFWILNLVSMLEKLAYWSVLLQLPIYIAQKDEPGGLGWEQSAKGWIYLFWALAQNLIPIFAGTFSDRLGRRKMLYLAFSIAAVAYVLIGTQREFYPFLFSVILLGLGLGIFKPSLQGALAVQMNEKNSSTGWGVYFMLLNVAVFAGPPLSKWLKEIAWEYVFVGSALIILLNFLVLLFFRDVKIIRKDRPMISQIFKKSIVDLSNKKLLSFIGLIAGFMLIYMQFYETLPNFIYDWSDTSGIASWLGLPQSLMMQIGDRQMISYEWLYNVNAIIVIAFVVLMSWVFASKNKINTIIFGISLAIIGLLVTGTDTAGGFLIAGMIIYSFGEIIVNPKYNEYISWIAPKDSKSQYLGYINLSFAIGLGGGSLLGGYLYENIGEKAGLSLDYIKANFPGETGIDKHNAFQRLMELSGLDHHQLTEMLWQQNNPGAVWYPFAAIGIASIIGLILYKRKFG